MEDQRQIPPFSGMKLLVSQDANAIYPKAFKSSTSIQSHAMHQMHMTRQVLPGDFQGLMAREKKGPSLRFARLTALGMQWKNSPESEEQQSYILEV